MVMTTLAERWLAQGEARGRAEGELDGIRRLLLSQLELKFGKLPSEAQALLERSNAEQVRKWSLRLLTLDSLAEVFSDGLD
jgi:predicted transposase YdaD